MCPSGGLAQTTLNPPYCRGPQIVRVVELFDKRFHLEILMDGFIFVDANACGSIVPAYIGYALHT